MEPSFSTSKVTVEYFDPHDVYKLVAPSLIPRLPLRNLHWQSHAGPLRSIDTLHVELVPSGEAAVKAPPNLRRSTSTSTKDDGFQTQAIGGSGVSTEHVDVPKASARAPSRSRRHQIPGLRQTPYLKVFLVRCDDSESYKTQVRTEIREWIKANTPSSGSTKKSSLQEAHDAFEWLIVHVVLPNTTAATQPRVSKSSDTVPENKTSSKWRGGSSTLLEKLRSDFNGTGKHAADRVAQVRVGINDVPYDMLPRVVPAVPSGYIETEQDVQGAWQDLVDKLKDLILSSFDMRVSRYEDDIKEKDAQRVLPGWNFCTFFILKEGLARGFESVGLVEDALVGYDELGVGLDSVIAVQAHSGSPESHGGALLSYTEDLRKTTEKVLGLAASRSSGDVDEEAVDLQSGDKPDLDQFDDIPIISSKKPYRDMILANNVSLFDFRCYIFARQISLLLRLGNAWSTREELLAKLKEQQDSVLHGVSPQVPPPLPTKQTDEHENLTMLAEICRRTLEFVPVVSQVMRNDILAAMTQNNSQGQKEATTTTSNPSPALEHVVDNLVASFVFSLAQQVLAQTSTKALPIPPSTLAPPDGHEPKSSIPEPKTMMHPARSSSLNIAAGSRPPPSPGVFPGPGRPDKDGSNSQFLKAGLEELAARRAELYTLCRNILEKIGKKKGWGDGWSEVPVLADNVLVTDMEDVSLDDDGDSQPSEEASPEDIDSLVSASVVSNRLLSVAISTKDDFLRLYETLTDKALRHYTVAGHQHSVQANLADLAVLKYQVGDYDAAAPFFHRTTPFFGEGGWSLLELSLLIMYCRCLKELQWRETFVQVVLKLLSKAAAAERDRFEEMSLPRLQSFSSTDLSATRGLVEDMLAATKLLPHEASVPLSNFFFDIDIRGTPEYHDGDDGFSLVVQIHNLLQDDFPVDKATLGMTGVDAGFTRQIRLECPGEHVIKPGKSTLTFECKDVATGRFKVDSLILNSQNLVLGFERDVNQLLPRDTTIFKAPPLMIYQQPNALDLSLSAAKHTRLDQDNSLDLEISTGWNSVKSCEVSVKPATGGLRLLMVEAKVVGCESEFARPQEGGTLFFSAMSAESSVMARFPFSVEGDIPTITVKLDASYKTERGTYRLSKTISIPVSLALGVNVQDVFKHHALYSRFTVSTASASPLRLFKSELLDSDIYESDFGVPPASTVLIFPRQPGTLLYKITRTSSKLTAKSKKLMYLKLYYSVVREDLVALLRSSVEDALEDTSLQKYSRLLLPIISRQADGYLSGFDLERAALTGAMETSFVSDIDWQAELQGLSRMRGPKKDGHVSEVAAFFKDWQKANRSLPVEVPTNPQGAKSILIPVDIPSIPILITADIKLNDEPSALSKLSGDCLPTVCVNQMLPATLHLRWTRRWDASTPAKGTISIPNIDVSFEVVAPPDTWLLGGRRKGHLRVPEAEVGSMDEDSTQMPLLLVPLREGWLPYPNVDVREVPPGSDDEEVLHHGGHCETDHKNLGEVVRVVADRETVTISLDSSGPGGGPLVLESQRLTKDSRVLA